MKSKNIPEDIKKKSMEEAQGEELEIIKNLENSETNLEKSINQYNRLLQLNNHVQEQFKKKTSQIKTMKLDKKDKILSKDKK